MAVLPSKFAAVVSALAVLVAHATCVCHATSAGAEASTAAIVDEHAAPSKPAHACCRHGADKPTDSPSKPGESPGECRHCSGQLTATSRPAVDSTVAGPTLQAPAFAIALNVPIAVAPQASASSDLAQNCSFPNPATLLRLHCALNL